MPTYYKNKYRSESTRLQNWDYRWDAAYFITICTKDRSPYFGKILKGQMELSNIGVLADAFWHEIKNHANNVVLDAFVVMPDHIHGILILTGNDVEIPNGTSVSHLSSEPHVGTGHAMSLHGECEDHRKWDRKTIGQQRFQNIGKNSVSSIIGSYKSAVTKHARRLGYDFNWQTRFYDHIIRDESGLKTIRSYIDSNVRNWKSE